MQNSDAAWDALLAGDVDAAIGYAPSEQQQQRLKEQGITLQKIGTDALVIVAGGTEQPIALTQERSAASVCTAVGYLERLCRCEK